MLDVHKLNKRSDSFSENFSVFFLWLGIWLRLEDFRPWYISPIQRNQSEVIRFDWEFSTALRLVGTNQFTVLTIRLPRIIAGMERKSRAILKTVGYRERPIWSQGFQRAVLRTYVRTYRVREPYRTINDALGTVRSTNVSKMPITDHFLFQSYLSTPLAALQAASILAVSTRLRYVHLPLLLPVVRTYTKSHPYRPQNRPIVQYYASLEALSGATNLVVYTSRNTIYFSGLSTIRYDSKTHYDSTMHVIVTYRILRIVVLPVGHAAPINAPWNAGCIFKGDTTSTMLVYTSAHVEDVENTSVSGIQELALLSFYNILPYRPRVITVSARFGIAFFEGIVLCLPRRFPSALEKIRLSGSGKVFEIQVDMNLEGDITIPYPRSSLAWNRQYTVNCLLLSFAVKIFARSLVIAEHLNKFNDETGAKSPTLSGDRLDAPQRRAKRPRYYQLSLVIMLIGNRPMALVGFQTNRFYLEPLSWTFSLSCKLPLFTCMMRTTAPASPAFPIGFDFSISDIKVNVKNPQPLPKKPEREPPDNAESKPDATRYLQPTAEDYPNDDDEIPRKFSCTTEIRRKDSPRVENSIGSIILKSAFDTEGRQLVGFSDDSIKKAMMKPLEVPGQISRRQSIRIGTKSPTNLTSISLPFSQRRSNQPADHYQVRKDIIERAFEAPNTYVRGIPTRTGSEVCPTKATAHVDSAFIWASVDSGGETCLLLGKGGSQGSTPKPGASNLERTPTWEAPRRRVDSSLSSFAGDSHNHNIVPTDSTLSYSSSKFNAFRLYARFLAFIHLNLKHSHQILGIMTAVGTVQCPCPIGNVL
ncbi:uncharacterized protein BDR25DRAFT_355119 [Lindgomyces ingoldianus]|uniref:Uncharacterized protein n=1 Tax=Lindgomyces ingoldianus TaxID=673940 RepID=A0ACB6QUE6_9PLEO|nr:uncharacterized protein BDR25DRAFT_355119 [Lindgomyces ingoldianus]KAF2470634.1 hypothetical protein BDR25DRAFT_355119 [Lindgomyces ingoldianus]